MELGYLIQFFMLLRAYDDSEVFKKKVWNSFVYRVIGTPPLAVDKNAYYLAFFNGFYVNLFNVFTDRLHDSESWVFYPNTPLDTSIMVDSGHGGTGGHTRTSTNQAVYVSLKTAARTRPFHGFKLFGPVAMGNLAGDELTPAAHTAWTNALANITSSFVVTLAGGGTNTIKPVVWSRSRSSGDLTVPPGIGADITGYNVNTTLSSCRHRRERTVR